MYYANVTETLSRFFKLKIEIAIARMLSLVQSIALKLRKINTVFLSIIVQINFSNKSFKISQKAAKCKRSTKVLD